MLNHLLNYPISLPPFGRGQGREGRGFGVGYNLDVKYLYNLIERLESTQKLGDFVNLWHTTMPKFEKILAADGRHGTIHQLYTAGKIVIDTEIDSALRKKNQRKILEVLQGLRKEYMGIVKTPTLLSPQLIADLPKEKLKVLATELNVCWGKNPNAAAMLWRSLLHLAIAFKAVMSKSELQKTNFQKMLIKAQTVFSDRSIKTLIRNYRIECATDLDNVVHHAEYMMDPRELETHRKMLLAVLEDISKQ